MTLKRTIILFPASFLMSMSLIMVNFAVIFYFKDAVGLSPYMIGWYFAAGSCVYAAGCTLFRPVLDRLVPPVSMFIALGIAVTGLFMIKNATAPEIVLAWFLFYAASPVFYWPPVMGWFSYGLNNRDLGKSISRFNISWSAGSLCGPIAGGLLAERNVLLAFYAGIGMIGAAALLLLLGLVFIKDMRVFPVRADAPPTGPATHEAGLEERDADDMINNGRGTVMRYAGWIGVFSVYVASGLLVNIFPLYLRDGLGLGESTSGNILFVRSLTMAVGFYLAGRFTAWHFNKRVMLVTQVIIAALFAALLLLQSLPAFYVLFILFGFSMAMAYSNGIFHGSAGARNRGGRMALFETVLSAGIVCGSVSGGYFYQYWSITTAYIVCAAIVAVGFGAQLFVFSIGKRYGLQ